MMLQLQRYAPPPQQALKTNNNQRVGNSVETLLSEAKKLGDQLKAARAGMRATGEETFNTLRVSDIETAFRELLDRLERQLGENPSEDLSTEVAGLRKTLGLATP